MNLTTRVAAVLAAALVTLGAACAEPVTITFGSPAPPKAHFNVEIFAPWAEKVTKDSEGTLKVDFVPGGVLGSHGQMYDRVLSGVADIGFEVSQYYPGRFPKSEVTALPFVFDTPVEAAVALSRLHDKGLIDEFKDVVVLGIFAFPNSRLMTKEPVSSIADVAGRKIIAGGKMRAAFTNAIGAVPVTLPVDETYQALNRGLAEGTTGPYTIIQPFRLTEVVKHYYDVPLGGTTGLLVINKAKFDSLPAQAKQALMKNSGEAFARRFGEFWAGIEQKGKDLIAAAGQEVTVPSSEDLKAWQAAAAPIHDTFAATTPDGAAVLKAFREEVADVKAGN